MPASENPRVPDTNSFADVEASVSRRAEEHGERILASPEFQSEQTYLSRLIQDFTFGLRIGEVARSRDPHHRKFLLTASADDLVESAVAIVVLGNNGIFNVGRRELRYMLEISIKAVYCDQQLPWSTLLAERIEFLRRNVPRSSIDPLDDLRFDMVKEIDAFRSDVRSAYGALSGYSHPSQQQLEERYRRVERGEFAGLETASTLRAFNARVSTTLDLILTLYFEGIGSAPTGDLFILRLDDLSSWKFHKTRFVSEISSHFDYKAERQRKPE